MIDLLLGSATGRDTERSKENGAGPPSLPLRVVESAGFVALATAVLYFMGYSYYAGYFARLSLPPPFPELSASDYFLQAFSGLDGFIVAALMSIPYLAVVPKTIWQAAWANAAFVVVPLVLAFNARSNGFLDGNLALLLAAVASIGIVATAVRISMFRLLTRRWGLVGAFVYAFSVILFFSGYFRLAGAADATRFIEGQLQPSASVVLRTGDPESPVDGRTLLVALMRNEGVYLVEQESPAPEAPTVYYVPEGEVRTATFLRTKSEAPPPAR